MKKLLYYVLYLVVVWGAFRFLFDFSAVVEELWFKPVIWLVPIFWWNESLHKRVGFFDGVLVNSVFFGLVLGMFYVAIVGKWSLLSNFNFDLFGVAMVTAVVEELALTGFVLKYLLNNNYTENVSVFVTGLVTATLRLPILFFDLRLNPKELFFVCVFVFATAVLGGLVRAKTNNVSGSIVARFILNLTTLV